MASQNFRSQQGITATGNLIAGSATIDGAGNALAVSLNNVQKINLAGNTLTVQHVPNANYWGTIYGDGTTNSLSERTDAVAIDSANNVIIVGINNNGGFVTKFNSLGVVQWEVDITRTADTSYAAGVALDSSNNIFVAAGTAIGFVVTKFNSSGVLQWQTFLTNDTAIKYKIDSTIIVDGNDDVIVAGNVDNNGVFTDAHVTKISNAGALVWSKFLTGASIPTFQDIQVDSSNNIYAVGGTTNYYSTGVSVVIKFNSSGTIQWQKDISVGTGGSALSLAVGTSNIYVAFEFSDSGNKAAIAKMAISDGAIVWSKRFTTYSGTWFQSITIDTATETLYLGGFYTYTTSNNTALIALDTNGAVLWSNLIGTSASEGEWWYGHRGIAFRNGAITLAGYTNKLGSADTWLVRVAADGSTLGTANYFFSDAYATAFTDYTLTPSTNGFTSAANSTTFATGDIASTTISATNDIASFSEKITINADKINVTGGVDKLTTASGAVSVAAATAPTTGQLLTATSSTTATWQTISGMVYPGSGIPNSTGSSWDTSYNVSGSGDVALTISPTFTTPVLGQPSSGDLTNCTASFLGTVTGNTDNGTTTGSAVVGLASVAGWGVYGSSDSGHGVYGNSDSQFGVYGISNSNYGVYGISTGTYGVYGTSTNGAGVIGISQTNYGVVAEGDTTTPDKAAFRIVPQDAEPLGANAVGDIYVSTAGVLNICTVAGTPGTWSAVGAGATLVNDTTTNSTWYPTFADATTGTFANAYVSSSKLTFVANTGTLSATVMTTLSDLKLKKDIETIENATSVIKTVEGVSFRWKDNDKKSYGVIAQELEKILPDLVITSEDSGMKTVNYSGLIGFLINAVKEMDERIKALEAKNDN